MLGGSYEAGKSHTSSSLWTDFYSCSWNMELYFDRKNNQGVSETSQASLPVLTINTGGEEINELHGYTESVDASLMRDSITPMKEDKFQVL